MRARLTLGELQARFAQSLQLHWLSKEPAAAAIALCRAPPIRPWVGWLDAADSPQIIVVAPPQLPALASALRRWENTPDTAPSLLILSDTHNTTLPVNAWPLACLSSSYSAQRILQTLAFHLAEALTETYDCHGVLMRIDGMGILLSGAAGIGKSEVALQLIQRGHALVADDAPLFYRSAATRLTGVCSPPLANFLEVRSLGLLNILAMYGAAAIAPYQELDLIIHIQQSNAALPRRLAPAQSWRKLGGVVIREVTLDITPARPVVALVEALARQHQLQQQGYDAVLDFSERQLHYMKYESP